LYWAFPFSVFSLLSSLNAKTIDLKCFTLVKSGMPKESLLSYSHVLEYPVKTFGGEHSSLLLRAVSDEEKKNVLWRFRQVSAELQAAQESADRYKKLEAEFKKVVDRDDQFCKNLIRWQSYKTFYGRKLRLFILS
jgi:hypothetical protein